jgi:hypothetical protein
MQRVFSTTYRIGIIHLIRVNKFIHTANEHRAKKDTHTSKNTVGLRIPPIEIKLFHSSSASNVDFSPFETWSYGCGCPDHSMHCLQPFDNCDYRFEKYIYDFLCLCSPVYV